MCNRHQSIFVSPAAWGLEEGVVRGPRLEFRKLGNGESCTYFAIMWAEKQATHSSLQILLPSCTFLFWEKTPLLSGHQAWTGKIQNVYGMASAAGLVMRDVQGVNCLLTLLKGLETKKNTFWQLSVVSPAVHANTSTSLSLLRPKPAPGWSPESLGNEGPEIQKRPLLNWLSLRIFF